MRQITDYMIGHKRREMFALCRSDSWRSCMKADKAGQFKVSTAQHGVNEEG